MLNPNLDVPDSFFQNFLQVQQIETLAGQMGLTCIKAFKMDATSCVREPSKSDNVVGVSNRDPEEEARSPGQSLSAIPSSGVVGLTSGFEPSTSERSQNGDLEKGKDNLVNGVAVPESTVETSAGAVGRLAEMRIGADGTEVCEHRKKHRKEAELGSSPGSPIQAGSRKIRPEKSRVNGVIESQENSPEERRGNSVHLKPENAADETKVNHRGETCDCREPSPSHAVSGNPDSNVRVAPTHVQSKPGPSPQLKPADPEIDSIKHPTHEPSKLSSAPGNRQASALERRAQRKEARWLRSNQKSAKPDKLEPGSFDRVLLDAPCSALGLRPRLFVGGVSYLDHFATFLRSLAGLWGVILLSSCKWLLIAARHSRRSSLFFEDHEANSLGQLMDKVGLASQYQGSNLKCNLRRNLLLDSKLHCSSSV